MKHIQAYLEMREGACPRVHCPLHPGQLVWVWNWQAGPQWLELQYKTREGWATDIRGGTGEQGDLEEASGSPDITQGHHWDGGKCWRGNQRRKTGDTLTIPVTHDQPLGAETEEHGLGGIPSNVPVPTDSNSSTPQWTEHSEPSPQYPHREHQAPTWLYSSLEGDVPEEWCRRCNVFEQSLQLCIMYVTHVHWTEGHVLYLILDNVIMIMVVS